MPPPSGDRSPLRGVDAALPVDRVDWSDLEFVKLAAYTRSAPLTPLHGCGGSRLAAVAE